MSFSYKGLEFNDNGEFRVGKFTVKLIGSGTTIDGINDAGPWNCIVTGPAISGSCMAYGATIDKAFGRAMNDCLYMFESRVRHISAKKARIEKELKEWKRLENAFAKADWRLFDEDS